MCEVNVCFTSRPMFRSAVKDRIPTHQISNVIYLFKCQCRRRYVGKTTQRLEARIAQHVPAKLTRRELINTPQSAIGEHLKKSNTCSDKFNRDQFTIVCKARTCSVLHVLEALYIKTLQQDLCKQMEICFRSTCTRILSTST